MKAIEHRLTKLERDTQAGALCYAWRDSGETADEAVARQYPDGIAENATVIVFQFDEPPP